MTMGDPRLGQRQFPVASTLWIQYSLPLTIWREEVSPKFTADQASQTHRVSIFGWMPASRRQLASLLTIISCFHALVLFTCSYHYSLYNAAYPAHDVLGYLSGSLAFALAYHSSTFSDWFERHCLHDGNGLLLCFFVVTLLMDLARFGTDPSHADYLGLRCDYGNNETPAWLCDGVRILRNFFHAQSNCETGGACATERFAFSSFPVSPTTFMHSFATTYFVSLAVTHSWATEISDFPANPKRDQTWWRDKPEAKRGRASNGEATSPHSRGETDPFLCVLMVSAAITALALTYHSLELDTLSSIAVRLAVPWLDLTSAQEAGLLVLVPKVSAGVFAISFSCMVVSYFFYEFRRAHNEVWQEVEARRTSRATNSPNGRRQDGRHSPIRTAVGIFAAHLYFQLPGGPIKRIFVEAFQWSSDLLHMTNVAESHRSSVLLVLFVGMLLLTIVPPWAGVRVGQWLSTHLRPLCSTCCLTTTRSHQPGSQSHTRMM